MPARRACQQRSASGTAQGGTDSTETAKRAHCPLTVRRQRHLVAAPPRLRAHQAVPAAAARDVDQRELNDGILAHAEAGRLNVKGKQAVRGGTCGGSGGRRCSRPEAATCTGTGGVRSGHVSVRGLLRVEADTRPHARRAWLREPRTACVRRTPPASGSPVRRRAHPRRLGSLELLLEGRARSRRPARRVGRASGCCKARRGAGRAVVQHPASPARRTARSSQLARCARRYFMLSECASLPP